MQFQPSTSLIKTSLFPLSFSLIFMFLFRSINNKSCQFFSAKPQEILWEKNLGAKFLFLIANTCTCISKCKPCQSSLFRVQRKVRILCRRRKYVCSKSVCILHRHWFYAWVLRTTILKCTGSTSWSRVTFLQLIFRLRCHFAEKTGSGMCFEGKTCHRRFCVWTRTTK